MRTALIWFVSINLVCQFLVYCSVLQCVAVCCSVLHQSHLSRDWQTRLMQHTATHCSTLQHTAIHKKLTNEIDATHCNTLQHTATHCNTQETDKRDWCNTLQHTATHCNTLQYTRDWQTRLVQLHTRHKCPMRPTPKTHTNQKSATKEPYIVWQRALCRLTNEI